MLDVASRLYHVELSGGSLSALSARTYLGNRRVFAASIDNFRIGYAPRGDWILDKLRSSGASVKDLISAGLMVEGQHGPVDPMGGRVVFPQTTPSGQVVGFLGRAIDPDVPEAYKYVATPQTALFRRSEILYRIDMAYRTIMAEQMAIVVEGALDAVLLWQIGQRNVVATGSARLTDAQAQILARYTNRIEVMFDRDTAGEEAFAKLKRSRGEYFQSVDRRDIPIPFKDPADWVQSVIDRRLVG